MKKLICLISTHGKTTDQIVGETWEAVKKYEKESMKATKEIISQFNTRIKGRENTYGKNNS